MGSYGRNFEFRIPPEGAARGGRYATNSASAVIPIGAPIMVDTAVAVTAGLGLQVVKLAPQATARGSGANKGILVYEYGPAAYAGVDPYLTTYSDLDFAPAGAAIQMVAGDPDVKVVFRNTVARTFLGTRAYPGRVMVAGMGATPTVVVGQFLQPSVGTDSGGYWEPTATEANGWIVVTRMDTTRAEVEGRLLF